jgi:FMN phosphatase YigB (HAD superfamily)
MQYRAAIFDFDGVINAIDYARAATFFEPRVALSLQELGRYWEGWLQRQQGRVDEDLFPHFWSEMAEELALPDKVVCELQSFPYLTLFEVYSDAAAALKSLRKIGLDIAILSNTLIGSLKTLLERSRLTHLVDVVMAPQISGFRKPEPEAYLTVVERLGVQPEACLYFDDEPVNVEGAATLGMRAYLVDRMRSCDDPASRVVCSLGRIERLV